MMRLKAVVCWPSAIELQARKLDSQENSCSIICKIKLHIAAADIYLSNEKPSTLFCIKIYNYKTLRVCNYLSHVCSYVQLFHGKFEVIKVGDAQVLLNVTEVIKVENRTSIWIVEKVNTTASYLKAVRTVLNTLFPASLRVKSHFCVHS